MADSIKDHNGKTLKIGTIVSTNFGRSSNHHFVIDSIEGYGCRIGITHLETTVKIYRHPNDLRKLEIEELI